MLLSTNINSSLNICKYLGPSDLFLIRVILILGVDGSIECVDKVILRPSLYFHL